MKLSLNGEWRLYMSEQPRNVSRERELADIAPLTALIPESLEATLERLGILPELYFGENALKAVKYERHHLWYAREFDYTAKEGVPTICFEGIDTVAEVFLNGVKLGDADNAFIPHEFEVPAVKEGKNELLVHIIPSAVIEEAGERAWKYSIPNYPVGTAPLRKPAFNHGWDIFPRLMCGAIWKGVYLEHKTPKLINDIYFHTKELVWEKAVICADYDAVEGGELKITGVCDGRTFTKTVPAGKGSAEIEVFKPKLWAPKGMGKPNLYNVSIEYIRGGETVERREMKLGIRKFELKRTSVTDAQGNGDFTFYVNGSRMYCLGMNHVPVDGVLSRNAERLPKALALLDDIGCNSVRVWGGGIYEADEFYDFCDEHGVAVWQDFMMACAVYPNTDEFCANLRREAEYQVHRLRNHPCIMLWAGDNECDSVRTEWFPEQLDPESNRATREIIPEVLARLDPYTPYIPSSPYYDAECVEKGTALSPEKHLWGPRNYWASDYISGTNAHFVSEVGFYGLPSADELRRFISAASLEDRYSDEWKLHSAGMSEDFDVFAALTEKQAESVFGTHLEKLEDYSFASQVFQAEAYKALIEQFLAQKWRRSGIMLWNLLNGWRQIDNALADYDFNKKIAYGVVKNLFLPLTVFIDADGILRVINNTENESYAEYKVTDIASGRVVTEGAIAVGFNSNTKVCVPEPPKEPGDIYLVEWSCRSSGLTDGCSGRSHYISGKPPYYIEKYTRLMRAAGLID